MPESTPKHRSHPFKAAPRLQRVIRTKSSVAYAELSVTSNFTFLHGGSHPDEYMDRAAELGHHAIALTDTHTLSGMVRGHVAAKAAGIRLVVGCRLILTDQPGSICVYPTDVASYGRLCRLLTCGKRRSVKGHCSLQASDLWAHCEGLLAVVEVGRRWDQATADRLCQWRRWFDDDRLSIAVTKLYRQKDARRLRRLARLGQDVHVPLVATNDVLYHDPARRPLQDVVTCIRHGCLLSEAGTRLMANSERHLKSPQQMASLFGDNLDAVARSVQIADRAAGFSLDQIRYQYPSEVVPAGSTPMQHLTELTHVGLRRRWPSGVPNRVRSLVEHELQLIEELKYAHYFLTVHDIVCFARSQKILCQGRGAAANSVVCYALDITAVDPTRVDMLFERFVSRERNEPPDIDIDFEHERREEVIQYLYRKYGRDRAALTAEVITYRRRSAVRDVGKALGVSLDGVDRLAKNIDGWDSGFEADRIREVGLNPEDPTLQRWIDLAEQLQSFPRHLSQHVGGFVITQQPLCELVPIENAAMAGRTVIEWDKDDIDAMGMLKVDCLGLGMLTSIRKCFEWIEQHHDVSWNLASVPTEDPAVYDMICAADTIGVFQIESRAQMSMLPRLKPRCYYDLVIEVAIVRPGPIQGQMVHPYMRRRRGDEVVTYPSKAVERVLAKTLGVPLFQEQVMSLAVVAAGFTPGQADQLRRAIAAWKSRGRNQILEFEKQFVGGMLERGYDRGFAERCFEQIKGFGDYGFPESHAASFALLVYVSAWLKCHHPAAFTASLLNSQPMGFYAPAQLVRDAVEHGVTVHPVDVNHSRFEATVSDAGTSLRLGLGQIKGMRLGEARRVVDAVRLSGGFKSIVSLWRGADVSVVTMKRLADSDAFGSMGLDRQAALWQVRGLRQESLPLFDVVPEPIEPTPVLPVVLESEQVVADYRYVGLSLRAHPVSFARDTLVKRGVIPAVDLCDRIRCPAGRRVRVGGLVLVRQRPGSASGVIFMTLEDETGIANLIVRPTVYDQYRGAAKHGVLVVAEGKVERDGKVVHLLVHRLVDLSAMMRELLAPVRSFR